MKHMAFVAAFVTASLSSTTLFADQSKQVFAEGRGESPVSEHVVRDLAKSRATAVARDLCHRYYGLSGVPAVIQGSGQDTAWYRGGVWSAHFYADFLCVSVDDTAPSRYGPWSNIDRTREYYQLNNRFSWWDAGRLCDEAGYRLPLWNEIATDYRYLKGTTPLLDNYRNDIGRDTPYFWVSEDRSFDLAHYFNELQLGQAGRDLRGMYKETRYAVLCVR